MRINILTLQQQIANLKAAYPELADDVDGWELTIESETDLPQILEQVVSTMRESASMAGGIAGRIAELEIRQGRYERREQAMRTLAFNLMQYADTKKCELPEATLSIRNGQPRVIITDEQAIPDDMCRIKREPDKTAIKQHILHGKDCPGATISNSEPTLSVRTK